MSTPERTSRSFQANIPRFYAFQFLLWFQLILPIWVIYLIDVRGLSLGQVTAMEGPFWLATVLLEVPTGAVADRFGRVTSLRCGAFVNALGMFLFAFADNYPVLFASYLLLALSMTLFSGADAAFFYDSLKATGREEQYQKLWGRCWALQSAGVGISLLAGAALAEVTSVQFAIVSGAVLTLPLILISFTLREPPRHQDGEVYAGFAAGTREAIRMVWRQPQLRTLMPLGAAVMGIAFVVSILAQPFLAQHDVAVGWWGALMVPGEAVGIVGALVAYRAVAYLGFPRTMLVLIAMGMLPLAAFAGVNSVAVFAVFPLAAAVEGTSQPVVSDYVNRRVPSAQRATVLSIYSFMVSLVAGTLIPISGAVAGSQGLQGGYALALAAGAVTLPLLYGAWLRAHRKYGSRPPVEEREPLPEPANVAAPRVGIAVHVEERET